MVVAADCPVLWVASAVETALPVEAEVAEVAGPAGAAVAAVVVSRLGAVWLHCISRFLGRRGDQWGR